MFPGSVVAFPAGPTTADGALGAAQTTVPSVLSSYSTTEFPSTFTSCNSPFQIEPRSNQPDSDKTARAQHCRSATLFDEYECDSVSCALCYFEWTMAEEWSQSQCACPCIQITLKITYVYLFVLKKCEFCACLPSGIAGSAISRVAHTRA